MIRVEHEKAADGTVRTVIECEDWHPESELAPWLKTFEHVVVMRVGNES